MTSLREKMSQFTGRRWHYDTLPGLGRCAWRSFAEAERAQVEAAAGHRVTVKRLAVIHSFCDPDTREPVYKLEDMDYLGTLDSAIIDMIAEQALKLSKLSPEDIKKLMGEPDAS